MIVKGRDLIFIDLPFDSIAIEKNSKNQKYDKESAIKNTTEQEHKRNAISERYSFGLFLFN